MNLEKAINPDRLYHALSADVDDARPLFTGDVLESVDIPGVGKSTAIVIAHPCSIRGRLGSLKERILVAAVTEHQKLPDDKWIAGYFDRMPLAGLPIRGGFHVARLDQLGLAETDEVRRAIRIACLSHPGINQLQQRLVFHLTRHAVPVNAFQEAFAHTYEEADLLEEWVSKLGDSDDSPDASFEKWIREGDPSRQERLQAAAERAPVRREMRTELQTRLGQRESR